MPKLSLYKAKAFVREYRDRWNPNNPLGKTDREIVALIGGARSWDELESVVSMYVPRLLAVVIRRDTDALPGVLWQPRD